MKPVNTKVFTDYLSIVKHPICFETVESKLKERGKNASYLTNESFVRDVRLIFQNCKSYNTDPVKGADICKLADVLADTLDRLLQLNPPPESEAKRTWRLYLSTKILRKLEHQHSNTNVGTFENLPKNSRKKKKKRSRDVMEANMMQEPVRSSSRPQKRSRRAEEAGFEVGAVVVNNPPVPPREREFRSHFRASAFNVPAPKPNEEVFSTLTPDEKTMDRIISRLWKVCQDYPFASCFQIPFIEIDPSKEKVYLKKIQTPMDFRTIKENIWRRYYLGVRGVRAWSSRIFFLWCQFSFHSYLTQSQLNQLEYEY